jgi:hypothetical protein|tara:strand:+ start:82 stop:681 length:600 start_codon:yes stop_codon:yes gene_type:complete
MKDLDATYDPTKNPYTPIEPGFYPAHAISFVSREVSTKVGDAIVINMTYEIAEEAGELTQLVYEMDGFEYKIDNNGDKIISKNSKGGSQLTKCKHLVGKKFRDSGTFVFTGAESSGRNRRYYDLLSSLGIKLESDKEGNFSLALLEESDVIGKPVLAKLGSEQYEKDGEKKTAWKVFSVMEWAEGQTLSKDEIEDDLPF